MKTLISKMAVVVLAVIGVYNLTVSAFAQMDYSDTNKVNMLRLLFTYNN